MYLFAKDHDPPHCYVKYGDDKALISLETGELLEGNLAASGAKEDMKK